MKILLAGGGTGGPVSPVLAVAEEIKKLAPHAHFLFIGTSKGPESGMVASTGIKFVAITAAKWRRYFSLKNLIAPILLFIGFMQALLIVRRFKPNVLFCAGGYVAVPVAWAAKIFGCKIVVHQQDVEIGLANKLIAPLARQITTAFEQTSKEFYAGSGLDSNWQPATWVGNPVRATLFNFKVDAKKYFNLHDELPILLVLGGATGSVQINQLIGELLPDLVKHFQVVHQTGKSRNQKSFNHPNYHEYELIEFDPYAAILNLAHLVICRAGLSTIAELSALAKTAIVLPLPGTHQERNAKILELTHSAVVLTWKNANQENLSKVINNLKFDQTLAQTLSNNISKLLKPDAAERLAKIVIKYAE